MNKYYGALMFGRWDKYVSAGKYKPVREYVYGNGLVNHSDYDENLAWGGRFTARRLQTACSQTAMRQDLG